MSLIASDDAVLSLTGTDVASLTTRRFSLSRPLSDKTAQADEGWQANSALAAPARLEISGEGTFLSSEAMAEVRSNFLSASAAEWSFRLPGDGVWSAQCLLRTLTLTGKSGEELGFALRLMSTGAVTFNAEQGGGS